MASACNEIVQYWKLIELKRTNQLPLLWSLMTQNVFNDKTSDTSGHWSMPTRDHQELDVCIWMFRKSKERNQPYIRTVVIDDKVKEKTKQEIRSSNHSKRYSWRGQHVHKQISLNMNNCILVWSKYASHKDEMTSNQH